MGQEEGPLQLGFNQSARYIREDDHQRQMAVAVGVAISKHERRIEELLAERTKHKQRIRELIDEVDRLSAIVNRKKRKSKCEPQEEPSQVDAPVPD